MLSKRARHRIAFSMVYSTNTRKAIDMMKLGMGSKEIAAKLGVSTMSVAAVRAHLTRQTYAPYAWKSYTGKVVGNFRF